MRHARALGFVMNVIAVSFTALASPAYAQSGKDAPPPVKTLELSGPRIGVTMISEGVQARLRERDISVGSAISQFGWQFERQFYSKQGGVTARASACSRGSRSADSSSGVAGWHAHSKLDAWPSRG